MADPKRADADGDSQATRSRGEHALWKDHLAMSGGESWSISSGGLMRLIYCRCAEKPMSHHHTWGEKTCTPARSRDTGLMFIRVVSTALLVAKYCDAETLVSAEI